MGVGVTWRFVAVSEVGTSHLASGAKCQDSCWASIHPLTEGQSLLSLFVADGAGSAVKGGEGADLAIQAAAAFLAKKIDAREVGLSDVLATDMVLAVRECIAQAAEKAGLTPRDYACTFLGLISSSTATLTMQIGDGGIVLDVGGGLELAITPMSGEYANMTHFVTDEEAVKRLETKVFPAMTQRAAVFTDGIQRLALNLAANTPHVPFFVPFFEGMAKATEEQEHQLEGLLVQFLGSAPVNERTDDDKTLVLALSMP